MGVYYVPEKTKSIAKKTFMLDESGMCNDIKEIRLPYGFKKIGSYAFYDCLPEVKRIFSFGKLEFIGECAFFGLDSLEQVILSPSIKMIEKHAFCNCSNLTIIIYGRKEKIPSSWHKEWNGNCKVQFSADWVLVGGFCPIDKEYGSIYAVKNKLDNNLYAYCDECGLLWKNSEDILEGDPVAGFEERDYLSVFEWGGYATMEEVNDFGWEKYIAKF